MMGEIGFFRSTNKDMQEKFWIPGCQLELKDLQEPDAEEVPGLILDPML
jgi:hypothetical protein